MIRKSKLRLPILLTLLALTISFFGTSSVNAQLPWIWGRSSNPSNYADLAYGVAVTPSNVYVVGCASYYYFQYPGNARWRIERRSPVNGLLLAAAESDPSLGHDIAYAVAVDATGVYVVGYDMVGGGARWRIEKRTLLGLRLIWVATSNPSSGTDIAYDVAVAPSGVYVVGYDMALGNARWRIERRSPTTGALLAVATINPGAGSDIAYGVAVDGTGVYIAGTDQILGPFITRNARWRIEKRTLLGLKPIWAATSDPSRIGDCAYDIAVGRSGLYIVGFDRVLGKANARWRIERRNPFNGLLLAAATSDPNVADDIARAVAVGDTGIYVVGGQGSGFDGAGFGWRTEKRTLLGLGLVWAQTFKHSGSSDEPRSVAYASSRIYTVGYDHAGESNGEWWMEKRTA